MNRLILLILIIYAALTIAVSPAFAKHSPDQVSPDQISPDQDSPTLPPGFYLVTSSIGTQLYRKDYPKGSPDFVQVIDLSQGASLELLHGDITAPGRERGDFGGDNPRFLSMSLEDYWDSYASATPTAFCITNGQFFFLTEYPTRLALPIKVNGEIITEGSGYDQYPWEKLILEIWDDHAEINRLSRWNLHTSSAPNLIAGLAEDANKKPNSFTGRTFFGVDDQDADGQFETVLIFNTLSSNQENAAAVLRDFGADKVIMLDGGGSTQLICQGQDLVKSDRLLPQVIAVSRGAGPDYAGMVIQAPDITILLEGDDAQVELEILNTGAQPWFPGDDLLVLTSEGGFSREVFMIEKPVFTGEKLKFIHRISPGSPRGVIPYYLSLQHQGQEFRLSPDPFSMIVLPQKLGDKKEELVTHLATLAEQNPQQLTALTDEWIENQEVNPENKRVINVPPVTTDQQPAKQKSIVILVIPFTIIAVSFIVFFLNRRSMISRSH